MNADEDGEKFTVEYGEGRRGEAMQINGVDAEAFFIRVHSRLFPATPPAFLRALLFAAFLT